MLTNLQQMYTNAYNFGLKLTQNIPEQIVTKCNTYVTILVQNATKYQISPQNATVFRIIIYHGTRNFINIDYYLVLWILRKKYLNIYLN